MTDEQLNSIVGKYTDAQLRTPAQRRVSKARLLDLSNSLTQLEDAVRTLHTQLPDLDDCWETATDIVRDVLFAHALKTPSEPLAEEKPEIQWPEMDNPKHQQ